MPNKQRILESIAKIAKKLGRAPSRAEFVTRTGISKYFVLKWFRSWSDAVRAAGLQPSALNARIEERALLEDWGNVVRRNGSLLPRHMFRRAAKYNPCTLAKRFGAWSSVPQAFRKFARGKREWADVLALLPAPLPSGPVRGACRQPLHRHSAPQTPPRKSWPAPRRDRPICGDPTPSPWLRHEPLNEQGVVLLFGMLAKDLGFMIETVQTGFPDCEAKRQIAPGRWQRVRIEFEYESKNFLLHGHPANGADLIVCWRHNWDACPAQIEVVELSSVIKSLPNSGD
jgi:Homing endonuclease associated repeat